MWRRRACSNQHRFERLLTPPLPPGAVLTGPALVGRIAQATLAAAPGASEAAALQVARTVMRSVTPATFEATARAFSAFEDFCDERGFTRTLPASPALVSLYIQELVDTRGNFGAISSAWRSVQFVHAACGMPAVVSGQCALMLRTARKEFVKDVRRMTPLSPGMVRKIYDAFLHDGAEEEAASLGIAMGLGYAAGARFSDLRGCDHGAVRVGDEALIARPVQRKNSRKRDGAPRPAALKEFAAARVGGRYCIVERYEFFARKFGWAKSERTLCPWAYGAFLGRYRVALQVACGLSAEAASGFGTHSGRRGAAHEARAGGADPRALRSFAGVTSTLWETWYADGLVPEERIEISRQLMGAVAGSRTSPG